MSTTTMQGDIFILLEVIRRQEEKRPEGCTELTKLKAIPIMCNENSWIEQQLQHVVRNLFGVQ